MIIFRINMSSTYRSWGSSRMWKWINVPFSNAKYASRAICSPFSYLNIESYRPMIDLQIRNQPRERYVAHLLFEYRPIIEFSNTKSASWTLRSSFTILNINHWSICKYEMGFVSHLLLISNLKIDQWSILKYEMGAQRAARQLFRYITHVSQQIRKK